MMKPRSCVLAAVAAALTSAACADIVFTVETDRPDALYRCGERAVFTVTAKDDTGTPLRGAFTARLDNFGPEVLATAEVDLAKTNVFTLAGTLAKPGFLRVHVDGAHQPVERRQLDYSVGFEPERIVPTDRRRAPFPVRVEVPGAGCGHWALALKPAPDAICCFLTVNDFEPDEDDLAGAKAKWDATNAALREKCATQEYSSAGLCESPEEAFFYPVILGINRAVDWLAQRDDVNRNSFTYQGTSQGGGMGIILAALNRNFTQASFFVPALTDMLGYRACPRTSACRSTPTSGGRGASSARTAGPRSPRPSSTRWRRPRGRCSGRTIPTGAAAASRPTRPGARRAPRPCSPGSGVQDLVGRNEALIDWVEKGVAPGPLDGRLKDGSTRAIEPFAAK